MNPGSFCFVVLPFPVVLPSFTYLKLVLPAPVEGEKGNGGY